MGSITRGIRLYNVWAGDGDPVASVEFGVTVENWGGRLVSIMTIDEKNDKFALKWDSGLSSSSRMSSSPSPISGSGGDITLNDDGWYKSFLSGGYSLSGSRVERTWDENGITTFSQGYADSVETGDGVVVVRLLGMSTQMDSDVTTGDMPLIVGRWENATIKKSDNSSDEIPFKDGVVFKIANNIDPIIGTDEAGAPITYRIHLAPSTKDFGDSLVFPKNTYCRIKSGHNEGQILAVKEGSAGFYSQGGKSSFVVDLYNDFGVNIDNVNEDGIVYDLSKASSIAEMSTFEFFTVSQEFYVGGNTTVQSPVIVNGKEVSNFTLENGTVNITAQFLSNPILYTKFHNNDNYDMSQYMPVSSPARDGNSYRIAGSDIITFENTDLDVSNHSRDGQTLKTSVFFDDTKFPYEWHGSNGLSYYVESIPEGSEGVCIDASMSTHQSFDMQIDVTVRIEIVAVWDGSESWLSQEHEEVVYSSTLYTTHDSTLANQTTYSENFGVDYFSEIEPNKQMEQFDDRESSQDHWENHHIRGRVKFKFGNGDILKSQPDRLYVLIGWYGGGSSKFNYINYDTNELKINELGFFGESSNSSSDGVDSITATVTGENWETIDTAIQNVAQKQDWGAFENVVVNTPELPYRVKCFITNKAELKTKSALKRLLREAWCVGDIDRNGEYSVVSVSGKMGDDEPVPDTHNFVLPHGYELVGNIKQYEGDELVTGGTIKYDRDSEGNFKKSITVTNADKAVFDESYVVGFDDIGTAQILWEKCHKIWSKTGILVDIRKDLSELWWLYEDYDAVKYFTNIVEWNGGGDFARDVITARIGVTQIDTDISVIPWKEGDPCRLMIPTKMNSPYSGVVEGVSYKSDYKAVVTVRVAEMFESVDRIIETGLSTTDKIIEDGLTGTDKITELGVI